MILGVILSNLLFPSKDYSNYRLIEYSDYQDTTTVDYMDKAKVTIDLSDSIVAPIGLYLIENSSNYNEWLDHKPIISFTKEPYRYKIRDVRFPYKVYKRKNSDTIEVFKDTFKLKFILPKPKKN